MGSRSDSDTRKKTGRIKVGPVMDHGGGGRSPCWSSGKARSPAAGSLRPMTPNWWPTAGRAS